MKEESRHRKIWGIVFMLLVVLIIVGGGVLSFQYLLHRGEPVEIEISACSATEMEVYLSGAVTEEGIYEVTEDTTLGDLLRSAGGATDSGDVSRIKLEVLGADESPYDTPTQDTTKTKININSASLEMLETLPGIGATKAQAIIDYRNANGPFRSIDELAKVKGIGTKTLDKIRDQITVVD